MCCCVVRSRCGPVDGVQADLPGGADVRRAAADVHVAAAEGVWAADGPDTVPLLPRSGRPAREEREGEEVRIGRD